MAGSRESGAKSHHPYRQGGRPKKDAPTEAVPAPAPNDKSWIPGQKGQGGEGLSKGYGVVVAMGRVPRGRRTKSDVVVSPNSH